MKKIMLIDDRTPRQMKFTEESGIKLDDYSDILDNYTADNYNGLLEEFRNDNFSKLNSYDVIITHRSAFGDLNGKVISTFKDFCKKNQKSLVLFSGGISNSSISYTSFEYLLLNSKTLYSNNLKQFLDYTKTKKANILVLSFGNEWKLNLLLNTLEKINFFIGKNQKKSEVIYKKFLKETNLDLIKIFLNINEPEINNNFVQMNNLVKFTQDLTNQIKQQVVLNV